MHFGLPVEFCVPGTPVSGEAGRASKDAWKEHVAGSARGAVAPDGWLHTGPLAALLIYFHFDGAGGIDADNMAKPILDALSGVIFQDDRQIEDLRVRRTELPDDYPGSGASPVLTKGLENSLSEEKGFVYIRIEGPPDHKTVPARVR